jgi:hypothetical protein
MDQHTWWHGMMRGCPIFMKDLLDKANRRHLKGTKETETKHHVCNDNKYSPNHTLCFQSTQPRTKLEARTGRRLNGCCCKSQDEFTLSQGKLQD